MRVENRITRIVGIIALFALVVAGAIPTFALEPASVRYQKGYDDACAGRVVSGHHTSDYKRGYADGQANCSHNGSGGGIGGGQSRASHTSFVDKVCSAVNNGEVDIVAALVAPLHIITAGTSAMILAAGHAYCLAHG